MASKGKVLFIDTTHPVIREELEAAGYVCDYFGGYKRDDFMRIIGEYKGVIIRSKIRMDEEILRHANLLEFIGRVGAGMESIDVEYAESKGIRCLNSPEGSRDAVGEQTLAMLLSLFNNLNRADAEVRKGVWKREENRGLEVKGKTIGIVGYGNMGSSFAEKVSGFGARVIAYDKYKFDYSNQFVKEEHMQTLFDECDILSLHVPLTEETTFLVNEDYLSKFQKEIYLINTARGKVVKTDALVNALKSGKVKGACLDVIEYEKLSFEHLEVNQLPEAFQYLIQSDKVVLSPHIAGWTHESHYKLGKVLADKVLGRR